MDHPDLAIDDPTGRSLYHTDRDIVLGHEFVGEVVGHGPGCTDQFPVGTRVTSIPIRLIDGGVGGTRIIGQHPEAQGSFGELLVIAEMLATQIDCDVSLDAASLTDAFAVGEFYVRAADVQPGEIPIVIGAGAIGLSAVAALAKRGIGPIVVSDFKAERRDLARTDFGAHVLVDPDVKSPFDAFNELRAERHLPGPAVVFECVGAASSRRSSSRSRWAPRIYCAGGWYTGDTLDITTATRQGVDNPVRRGTDAAGLVRHPRCDRLGKPRPDAQRRSDHRSRRGACGNRFGPQVRWAAADHRPSECRGERSEGECGRGERSDGE